MLEAEYRRGAVQVGGFVLQNRRAAPYCCEDRRPKLAGPRENMSPFHRLDVLHEGRVIRVQRSKLPYQDAAELNQERLLLREALDKLGRTGRGLLIDSRLAPHSTDERLQEEFRRFRIEVARGFDRVAALVRTKVAILQVHRLVADPTSTVQAFDDEAAALAYLLAQPTEPRTSLR